MGDYDVKQKGIDLWSWLKKPLEKQDNDLKTDTPAKTETKVDDAKAKTEKLVYTSDYGEKNGSFIPTQAQSGNNPAASVDDKYINGGNSVTLTAEKSESVQPTEATNVEKIKYKKTKETEYEKNFNLIADNFEKIDTTGNKSFALFPWDWTAGVFSQDKGADGKITQKELEVAAGNMELSEDVRKACEYYAKDENFKTFATTGDGDEKTISKDDVRVGREEQAIDFFIQKGLTVEQSVGIVANLSAESGFNPTALGDKHLPADQQAHGIGQWRNNPSGAQRYKDMQDSTSANGYPLTLRGDDDKGFEYPSFRGQLEYVWHEITNAGTAEKDGGPGLSLINNGLYNDIKNTKSSKPEDAEKTVYDVARIFCLGFETYNEGTAKDRGESAQKLLKKHGGVEDIEKKHEERMKR